VPWDFWLIFFFLGVLLPWRGRVKLRRLLALPSVGATERISLYASTIAFQWLATAIVAWRAWAHGYSAKELGLGASHGPRIYVVAIVGAATLGLLHTLNLRRMSRLPQKSRGFLQALAERILPQSMIETLPYFALAVTAGLCEEFIYRGFAMAALARVGLPNWGVVLLSSVLFGLAHLYQGAGGLVGTLVVGAIFGTGRIAYDALIPVMFWHITVDAVAGIAGPRYLVRGIDRVPEKDSEYKGFD
jgi:membrane protease YdiL (CAAX protease family)